MKNEEFIQIIWDFYAKNSRNDLPWRVHDEAGCFDPYHIVVSEIMLQQTQVSRVIPKYIAFLEAFPTWEALAAVDFKQVLQMWSGLGYTRRAKYLHDISKQLVDAPFPDTVDELVAFKGIGKNTAAAILTYTHNCPYIFIETNIRTVFMYHFFANQESVDDAEVLGQVIKIVGMLNDDEYRDFYWAIMDYGTHLKASGVRNNAQSKHYSRQSKFAGSKRQLRGSVMKYLANHTQDKVSVEIVSKKLQDPRLDSVLKELDTEGLLSLSNGSISLQ